MSALIRPSLAVCTFLILLTPVAALAQDEPIEIEADAALRSGDSEDGGQDARPTDARPTDARPTLEPGEAEDIDLGEAEVLDLGEAEEIDLGEAEVRGLWSLKSLLGSSRAITVLPAAAFAGATTLPGVLERVPGLDIRSLGGAGQLSTAQIRGAKAEQVLILIDGAPFSPGQASDLSVMPIGALQRVEVVRGPAASRFGAGALGGVVNLVTKRPPDIDRHDDPPLLPLNEHIRELWGADKPRTTLTELELTAGGHGVVQATVSLARPGESYFFSHSQAQNNFEFRRAGGGTASRRNNESRQDSFWAAWQSGGSNHRAGANILRRGAPGSAEFPTLRASLARENLWWQVAGSGWRGDLSLAHTHFSDPEPYLKGSAIDLSDTQARLEFSTGSLALTQANWGIKPSLDYVDSEQYGKKHRLGLQLHRHWESAAGGTERQLDLGLVSASDVSVDPVAHLGFSRELGARAKAYASVGYAVRHPGFAELYLTDMGSVQGNPELKPERVLSYELGGSFSGAGARFEAAAFFSDYRESIIFAPVSAYLVRAINTGPARVAGAEALFDAQLRGNWWWRTAYTWLPLAEYSSGVPLTGRANRHANSRIEYLGKQWSGALSLDYTGGIPADLFGNLVIEPRLLTGLELMRSGGSGQIGMTVNNLFDEDARDAWNYPLPGREIYLTWRIEL